MTTANGAMNARAARKSLGDQIDRLDGILDGLAEALNESVADAVKDVIAQTTREAVHAAVSEVLSSPDLLRAALEKHDPVDTKPTNPATNAPHPKPPTLKENVARIAGGLRGKLEQAASLMKEKSNAAARTARTALAVAPMLLRAAAKKAWEFRKPCAVAVGVGVLFGTACYFGGQVVSGIANAASGAAITLSALTLPLKRLFWGVDR